MRDVGVEYFLQVSMCFASLIDEKHAPSVHLILVLERKCSPVKVSQRCVALGDKDADENGTCLALAGTCQDPRTSASGLGVGERERELDGERLRDADGERDGERELGIVYDGFPVTSTGEGELASCDSTWLVRRMRR